MDPSAQERFEVVRLYRDTFGETLPNVTGIQAAVLHNAALRALLRGAPITDEELRECIRPNKEGGS